jgi:hypothetical protein
MEVSNSCTVYDKQILAVGESHHPMKQISEVKEKQYTSFLNNSQESSCRKDWSSEL